MPIQTLIDELVDWNSLTLLHGTALALLTWVLSLTLLARARPALKAALWTIVLIKFVLPVALPIDLGLSGWLSRIGQPDSASLQLFEIEGIAIESPSDPAQPAKEANDSETGPSPVAVTLFCLYLLGLAVLATRSVRSVLAQSRRIRSLPEADRPLETEVRGLCKRIGLRRPPRVRMTNEGTSPYVTGTCWPTLVFPTQLLERVDPSVRPALIVHELAHIRRGDLWVRGLQNVARVLFFFWPPVWWVAARIDHFTEVACDHWALAFSKTTPDAYARSLLEVIKGMRPALSQNQILTFARSGRLLERRFDMILKNRQTDAPKLSRLAIAGLAGWACFVLSGAPQAQSTAGSADLEKFAGTWVLTSAGKQVIPLAELAFDGSRLSFKLGAVAPAVFQVRGDYLEGHLGRSNSEGEEFLYRMVRLGEGAKIEIIDSEEDLIGSWRFLSDRLRGIEFRFEKDAGELSGVMVRGETPSHGGMWFRFRVEDGRLDGFLLMRKWDQGVMKIVEEVPLVDFELNDPRLSFRLPKPTRTGRTKTIPPNHPPPVIPPLLEMKRIGERFEGRYATAGTESDRQDPLLKLIRVEEAPKAEVGGLLQVDALLFAQGKDEDTLLFESGVKHLQHERFVEARLDFQKVINTYPDSNYTPSCFLQIADAYNAEGGRDNWLQAEMQYRDFVIFYPTHESADDALFRIGKIHHKLIQDDGTGGRKAFHARKALSALENLLQKHPGSELKGSAWELQREIEDFLKPR